MKTTTLAWIVIVVLVLAGGWYYLMNPTSPQNTETNQQSLTGQQPGTTTSTGSIGTTTVSVYSVHDTKLGDHLLAANGMTLYRYTKDTANTSKCTGTCADSWPPYVSVGPLKASSSTPGKLATTTRPDGSIQITYKGMPLYFWKGDTKSGDATGEGVGGVWFVVKP